jgi:DnaJ-class molecular chaperone
MKHQIAQIEADLVKLNSADPLACVYCFTSGKVACTPCMVFGKSTGKLQCERCKSTGRMKCAKCDGKFALKCKSCKGSGYIYYIVKSYYGNYRSSRTCRPCSGAGYMHYDVTSKRYRYSKCSYCSTNSPKGSAVCVDCSGGGGTKACRKCDGDKTLRCSHCRAY